MRWTANLKHCRQHSIDLIGQKCWTRIFIGAPNLITGRLTELTWYSNSRTRKNIITCRIFPSNTVVVRLGNFITVLNFK